jgi:hypothetical protein
VKSWRVTVRNRRTYIDYTERVYLADDEWQAKRRAIHDLSKTLGVEIEDLQIVRVTPL